MENPDADETQEFVKKLNELSGPFLSASPDRDSIAKRFHR
jgi:prolyl oligopeptidase PreP (S9A serine peptidase family)